MLVGAHHLQPVNLLQFCISPVQLYLPLHVVDMVNSCTGDTEHYQGSAQAGVYNAGCSPFFCCTSAASTDAGMPHAQEQLTGHYLAAAATGMQCQQEQYKANSQLMISDLSCPIGDRCSIHLMPLPVLDSHAEAAAAAAVADPDDMAAFGGGGAAAAALQCPPHKHHQGVNDSSSTSSCLGPRISVRVSWLPGLPSQVLQALQEVLPEGTYMPLLATCLAQPGMCEG